MKTIIIVSHNFPPESVGGASRIYEMARELNKSYNVEIICSPPTYPFTKFPISKNLISHEEIDGIKVHRVWTYQPTTNSPSFLERISYYTFHSIFSSLYLIKKCKGDVIVIVTNPPPTLLLSSIITRIFRKKVIIDVRDLWIDAAVSLGYIKNGIVISVIKKFEKYCLKNSWFIITNSLFIKQELQKIFLKKKIEYVPFNVNTVQFQKEHYGLENDLVYIGNIGKAQNLQKLIVSISLIIEKNSNIKLIIYGGGDDENNIKKLIQKLKLEQNIIIKNPIQRKEIPKILSKSKIGIVPLADNSELKYAIPTKTFEYFACKLPVIAFGASIELKKIISEHKTGFFIENGVKELAEKIEILLNNNEICQEFGENGRKFVTEQNKFSFLEEKNNE